MLLAKDCSCVVVRFHTVGPGPGPGVKTPVVVLKVPLFASPPNEVESAFSGFQMSAAKVAALFGCSGAPVAPGKV